MGNFIIPYLWSLSTHNFDMHARTPSGKVSDSHVFPGCRQVAIWRMSLELLFRVFPVVYWQRLPLKAQSLGDVTGLRTD
jgi:hypothetical protein